MKKFFCLLLALLLTAVCLPSCAGKDTCVIDYIYVQYVDANGFYGSDTYVRYPNADKVFKTFDTVRVEFCEADVKETESTVTFPAFDGSETTVTYRYRIDRVRSARRSDYNSGEPVFDKPVIYLYPERETDVNVRLAFRGTLTETIPAYPADGWNVKAFPDGTLQADGKTYPYLFWEGVPAESLAFANEGFCVRGADTAAFLARILPRIGLNKAETDEFIAYWLPRMAGNPYNVIRFHGDDYTRLAPLAITPSPDSVLRVFMSFSASDTFVSLPPQTFAPFARTGFTVVEWGGCEVRD